MRRTCSNCGGHLFVPRLCANVCRRKDDALITLPVEQASGCSLFSEEDENSNLDYLVILGLVGEDVLCN